VTVWCMHLRGCGSPDADATRNVLNALERLPQIKTDVCKESSIDISSVVSWKPKRSASTS